MLGTGDYCSHVPFFQGLQVCFACFAREDDDVKLCRQPQIEGPRGSIALR